MYELKKLERLLGPGPRLMKKEFTGPLSHKFEKHWFRVSDIDKETERSAAYYLPSRTAYSHEFILAIFFLRILI